MSDAGLPPPPRAGEAHVPLWEALRADLSAAGWTVGGVSDLVGEAAQRALARDQAVPARRAVAGVSDPRAVLLDLFVLGAARTRREVDSALPRTGVAGLDRLALVTTAGAGDTDEVRAGVDLEPHAVSDEAGEASWWIVSDHGELALGGVPLPADHVLGAGTASMTLVEAVIPPSAGTLAADVGCGSGVQTLHLSRGTRRLVATDASARAVAFSRATLALNGVDAQVRHGDLFDPLAPGAHDRLVSNLPFVITPRGVPGAGIPSYTYRDGGSAGDALSARAVTRAPGLLAAGGIAQLLANWEVRAGEDWEEPVRRWLAAAAASIEGSGDVLDAWVVQRELADPALYAEAWITDGGRPAPDVATAWYHAWLDDFAARDVESIGFGVVTLRRRRGEAASALRRLDDHPHPLPAPLRVALAAGLAGHDTLVASGALADPVALLGARLRVADGVLERRDHAPGAADPLTIGLVEGTRLGRQVRVSTELAAVVGACDGELTVGAITAAVAGLLDEPEGELRARVLPALVRLVADGMLLG